MNRFHKVRVETVNLIIFLYFSSFHTNVVDKLFLFRTIWQRRLIVTLYLIATIWMLGSLFLSLMFLLKTDITRITAKQFSKCVQNQKCTINI